MTPHEDAITFDCCGERLVGVVSRGTVRSDIGVIILVGGPQYRVGSHRQFVELARALAERGWPTLRFDFRGMGDSEGQPRDFEDGLSDDIAAAIEALTGAIPQVRRVVLWGLCGGANAALMYQYERADPRVAGAALANPWIRTSVGQAKAQVHHYYLTQLLQRRFWIRLLRGGYGWSAATGFVRQLRKALGRQPNAVASPTLAYHQSMAAGWLKGPRAPLLLMSENDLTAREFDVHVAGDAQWQQVMKQRPADRVVLAGADHTCSQPAALQCLVDATAAWLARLPRPTQHADATVPPLATAKA